MELEQRAVQRMTASIEAAQATMDTVAGPLSAASQLVVQAVLSGGKVLSCGNAATVTSAQRLTTYLATQFENERPSLPAITLGTDSAALTALASAHGFGDVYSRTIQSLGQENDLLIVFSCEGLEHNLIQAVMAAHDRDMSVVAIAGHQGGDLADLLRVGDVEVRLPSSNNTRIQELQVLIIHCLCDLIDHQLFGVD